MNSLSWWWPTPERLNEILLSDAASHDPAVALAVHQKMRILRRKYSEPIGASGAEAVDEHAILARLFDAAPDGCQVILVEGRSGTGKSHVVRWLEIQLGRQVDRDSRVVLPVGKGSRLRDIVKRLCDRPELAGEEYSALRKKLERAQDPIDPADAAGRLCQQLAHVCQTRHESAKKKAESGHTLSEIECLYRKWGNPQQLPHILIYQPLRPFLTGEHGPMRRLVENLHAKANILKARDQQEFLPSDLKFEHIPDDLDVQARRILGYLDVPVNQIEAARVLNDALDEAKRILVGLNPGVVSEVFKSIRTVMLSQRKELVLLVEDFADLSGLQREVMQAAIQDGNPGGVATYCTLRTVLAYTDNLIQEGTVLSRAQHVYYVPSTFDEAAALDCAVSLVAAYLRAARFGKDALGNAERGAIEGEWLPTAPSISDEAQVILNDFGVRNGILLFPFSQHTIKRLLLDQYKVGDGGDESFPYIPRDIVTSIMRRILSHRDSFLRGIFPTEAFVTNRRAQLSRVEADWLRRTTDDQSMRSRLERFLLYWGLNKGAARAFGLLEPDVAVPVSIIEVDKQKPTLTLTLKPTPIGTSAQFGTSEKSVFEEWRKGTPILTDRNLIRKAFAAALRPAFTWAWMPRKEAGGADYEGRWKMWHEGINIAGMPPAQGVLLAIDLVSDVERDDSTQNDRTAQELTSLYAAASIDSWDIDGVENYLAAHMSFVERHREAVEKALLAFWHSREWNILPWLVGAIQHMGAALGVPKPKSSRLDDFVESLFVAPPAPMGPPATDSEWRRALFTQFKSIRESLQDILRREVGAFQGTGNALHALDATRFVVLLPKRGEAAWTDLEVPDFPPGQKSDHLTIIKSAKDAFRVVDQSSQKELAARHDRAAMVSALLGAEPDKDIIVSAVRAFRKAAFEAGVITGADDQLLDRAATSLSTLAVVTSLRSAESLPKGENSFWERLVALSKNEPEVAALRSAAEVIMSIKSIMDGVERKLPGTVGTDPLDEARQAHRDQLTQARTLLAEMSAETSAEKSS